MAAAQRDSRSRSPRREPAPTTPRSPTPSQSPETVDEEDLCPICHLLLYNPVTTTCNHTMCATCMAHWTSISQTTQMNIMAPSLSPTLFSGAQTDAKCPMCRTRTSSTPNPTLNTTLQQKYPVTSTQRATEENIIESEAETKTLTLYIGNTHTTHPSQNQNKHTWTFFLHPSHPEIIQHVEILLHPTFRPNRLFLTSAPYELKRTGWGYFTITAYVVLKQGWCWREDEAETVPFRRDEARARLPLDWTLDFEGFGGRGSMGRCGFRVGRVGEGESARVEEEEEEEDGRWEVEWVDQGDGDDD